MSLLVVLELCAASVAASPTRSEWVGIAAYLLRQLPSSNLRGTLQRLHTLMIPEQLTTGSTSFALQLNPTSPRISIYTLPPITLTFCLADPVIGHAARPVQVHGHHGSQILHLGAVGLQPSHALDRVEAGEESAADESEELGGLFAVIDSDHFHEGAAVVDFEPVAQAGEGGPHVSDRRPV